MRPAKTILVFISSPGDCGVERAAARRLVENLNQRPEIIRQGLRFEPLLWEDLPPGIADEGDFQKRVTGMMTRFGYDDYGIYLGFMKGLVGTPTPRYPSGTIEEFEASLIRRKRTGLPTEVLFYFLDSEAPTAPDVEAFKQELRGRHLLFSEVPEGIFAEQLERNLVDIARSWSAWRNVARRLLPLLRRAALVVTCAGVLALGTIDFVSRKQIDNAVSKGDAGEAADLWLSRRIMMPISGMTARHRINDAIRQGVMAEAEITTASAQFGRWSAHPVTLPDNRDRLREYLRGEVGVAIDAALFETGPLRGLTVWNAATRAGIWTDARDEAARSIERLSAARLLETLSDSELPPQQWRGTLLRPAEYAALAHLSAAIIAHDLAPPPWADRRTAVAIAVLADTPQALGRLATEAVRDPDSIDPPEMRAFIELADPTALQAWLLQTISPDLPSYIVARIAEAVDDRGSAVAILALIELAEGGRFPDPGVSLLSGVACQGVDCAAMATRYLIGLPEEATPSLMTLSILLPALNISTLTLAEREKISALILQDEDGPPTETLDALSRLDTRAGRAVLEDLIERHEAGRISFGFAEREILIDHLRRHGDPVTRLARARRIQQQTVEDRGLIESSGALSFGMMLGDQVERAYLDLLGDTMQAATPADQLAVEAIIDRLVARVDRGPLANTTRLAVMDGTLSLPEKFHPMRDGLRHALMAAPESWVIDLLAYPPAPLVDPAWEEIWARRLVILGLLAKNPALRSETLAEVVITHLPQDEELRSPLFDHASALGPDLSRAVARRWLEEGKSEALADLTKLGDAPTLMRLARGQEAEAVIEVLPLAAEHLDSGMIPPLVQALADLGGTPSAALLGAAADAKMSHPALMRAARDALARPEAGGSVQASIRYLSAVSPDDAWAEIAKPGAIDWLVGNDLFNWETTVQELLPPEGSALSDAVLDLAGSRLPLVVFDDKGNDPRNIKAGLFSMTGGQAVTSRLLALLAVDADPAFSLRAIVAATRRLSEVETLGSINNDRVVARLYLSWLSAGPLRIAPLECKPSAFLDVTDLDDNNPMAVRAAASLILARPLFSLLERCIED